MEVQQLIEWFGGIGLFIAGCYIVIKSIWKKLEDRDKKIDEKDKKLEEKDALIKQIVSDFGKSIKEVAQSNQEAIGMRDDEWFRQFAKFTEAVADNRRQMKEDREEGREVLKEHNGLMTGIKDATIQINGIVQRTENNVQELLRRKD